jgi:hypothetical protein
MMTSTLRTRVLRSYISALRARKIICAEDTEGSQRALRKIREEYEKHRNVKDPQEIEKLVEIAEQAREYALKAIIQGKLNERGAYGTMSVVINIKTFNYWQRFCYTLRLFGKGFKQIYLLSQNYEYGLSI